MIKLRNVAIGAFAILMLFVGGTIVYGTVQAKSVEKVFSDSGYILNGSETLENGYAKYSFEAGTTYRTAYPDRVVFRDAAGVEVSTDHASFLHFSDGSISSMMDGVLVDLNNHTGGMLNNFGIAASTVLERRDNSYVVESLSGSLYLDDFIWKISDSHYILVSPTIDINADSDEARYFNNFVELKYYNKGILQMVTEEGAYRTVAADCIATLSNGVRLDLASRTVLAEDGGADLSLEQIVLDSDKVIDVLSPIMAAQKSDDMFAKSQFEKAVDIALPSFEVIDGENGEDGEDGEHGENGEDGIDGQNGLIGADGLSGSTGENGKAGLDGAEGQDGNAGAPGAPGEPGTAGASGSNGSNGGTGARGKTGEKGKDGKSGDEELEDTTTPEEMEDQMVLPVFNLESLSVTSKTMNAVISITDKQARLGNTADVRIVREADGKQVYRKDGIDISTSTMSIEVDEGLIPEEGYRLEVSAEYLGYQNVTFVNIFLSKSFYMDSLGLELSFAYATSNTLTVNYTIKDYSDISSVDIRIVDAEDPDKTVLETRGIDIEEKSSVVTFPKEGGNPLASNHKYRVEFCNIRVNGLLYGDPAQKIDAYGAKDFYTLKRKPSIGNPIYSVNKVEGIFDLALDGVVDPDMGITGYRYEIYEKETGSTVDSSVMTMNPDGTPVGGKWVKNQHTTTNRNVLVNLDGDAIKRDTEYCFRVVASFHDNEKIIEFASDCSPWFSMTGTGFPVIRFEPSGTDSRHDYLRGTIIIETKGSALTIDGENPLTVQYTSNTTGKTEVVTFTDPIGEGIIRENSNTEKEQWALAFNPNMLKADEDYIVSVWGTLTLDGTVATPGVRLGTVRVHTIKAGPLNVMMYTRNQLSDEEQMINSSVLFGIGFSEDVAEPGQESSGHAVATAKKLRLKIYSGGVKNDNNLIYDDTPFDAERIDGENATRFAEKSYGKDANGNDKRLVFVEPGTDTLGLQNVVVLNNLIPDKLQEDEYLVELAEVVDHTEFSNKLDIGETTPELRIVLQEKLPDENLFIKDPLKVTPIYNNQVLINNWDNTKTKIAGLPESAIVGFRVEPNYGRIRGNEAAFEFHAFEYDDVKWVNDATTQGSFYTRLDPSHAEKVTPLVTKTFTRVEEGDAPELNDEFDESVPGWTIWFGEMYSVDEMGTMSQEERNIVNELTRGRKYVFTLRISFDGGTYFPAAESKVAITDISKCGDAPYLTPTFQFAQNISNSGEAIGDSIEGHVLVYDYIITAADRAAVGTTFNRAADHTAGNFETENGVSKNNVIVDALAQLKLVDVSGGKAIISCSAQAYKNGRYGSVRTVYVVNESVDTGYNQSNVGNPESDGLRYEVDLNSEDMNRLSITIKDVQEGHPLMNRIAGLRVTFRNESFELSNRESTIDVDIAGISTNGTQLTAFVPYSSFERFIGFPGSTMSVEVLFDNGVGGFGLWKNNSSARFAIQTVEEKGRGFYIRPNYGKSGIEVDSEGQARDSLFRLTYGSDARLPYNTKITLSHKGLGATTPQLELNSGERGVRAGVGTETRIITLKKLEVIPLKSKVGDAWEDAVSIDGIDDALPTVTLNNSANSYKIRPYADYVEFDFDIEGHLKIFDEISESTLHVDLYKYENGSWKLDKENCLEIPLDENVNSYSNNKIQYLAPNQYYAFTLYFYKINDPDKYYPLDSYNMGASGAAIKFPFNTADSVQVMTGSLAYSASSYQGKSIGIYLHMSTFLGYELQYELVRKEGSESYTTLLNQDALSAMGILQPTTNSQITSNDVVANMNIRPGQVRWEENSETQYLSFSDPSLYLKITPVSIQDKEPLDLSKVAYLSFAQIQPPSAPRYDIAVVPQTSTSMKLQITAFDTDKTLVSGRYKLRIKEMQNGVLVDITDKFQNVYNKTFESGSPQGITLSHDDLSSSKTYTVFLYAVHDLDNDARDNAGMVLSEVTDAMIDDESLRPDGSCFYTYTTAAQTLAGDYFLGNVSVGDGQSNMINLYFVNSVNLEETIGQVKYTIVDSTGHTVSKTQTLGVSEEGNVKTMLLTGYSFQPGHYTIMFEFVKINGSASDQLVLFYAKN